MEKTIEKRGGFRPKAGRPRNKIKNVSFWLTIPDTLKNEINENFDLKEFKKRILRFIENEVEKTI